MVFGEIGNIAIFRKLKLFLLGIEILEVYISKKWVNKYGYIDFGIIIIGICI